MHDLSDAAGRTAAEAVFPCESFHGLLEKEIERSRRYYRGFGLLEVRSEGGVPPAWTETVSRLLRRADIVALGPGGELYVLLPETPPSGMPVISRRVAEALTRSELCAAAPAAASIGQASFPRDGLTPADLLEALHATA